MSLLRIGPRRYEKRLSPYAASDPITTARNDALAEVTTLLAKRFTNSSRTVEVRTMVSGDRPSERQPRRSGSKSHHGSRAPCMTSGAVLNEVDTVQ